MCELNSTSKTMATVAPQRVGQVKSRVPTGPKQNYKLYATLLKLCHSHGASKLQSNSDSTARLTSFPATLNMKIVFPPLLFGTAVYLAAVSSSHFMLILLLAAVACLPRGSATDVFPVSAAHPPVGHIKARTTLTPAAIL